MLDQAARDKLIEDNLGYVRALATQLRSEIGAGRLDLEELVAYGAKGLVEAAQRFDPTRGAAFSTFAYYRIRGAIFDGLRQIGHLGRSGYARFARGADDYLANVGERAPVDQPNGQAANAVADLARSLDDVATIFLTAMGTATGDELADTEQLPVVDALEMAEVRRQVQAGVARLPEKERRLVELYYFQSRTLEAAGQELGLSKSWSSRLHARAIRLLAEELADLG